MKKQYKAIIFDFDGTLVDSVISGIHCFMATANELGIKKPTYGFLKEHWGMRYSEIIQKAKEECGWNDEQAEILERQSSLMEKSLELFVGIQNYLFDLKQRNIERIIISSRKKESLIRAIKETKLDQGDFLFIQALEDCEFSKPDPRVFCTALSLLKQLGICKEEVCYIGDTNYDFEAARDAGIDFFAVLTGTMELDDWFKIGVKKENIFSNLISILNEL